MNLKSVNYVPLPYPAYAQRLVYEK